MDLWAVDTLSYIDIRSSNAGVPAVSTPSLFTSENDRMRRQIVAICAIQRATLCLTVACLLAFSGCGDGKIGRNKVNGVVTVDGKPAAGMMVIFVPEGGTPEFQKARQRH